eukprot:TRINITY_DN1286_c0_g1_i1.p1 TRINITY_DN1286_c0_g1~~TRINITY_DN1286_c0_g1_i1.p1  ORF type:complete len:426 (-),score=115.28 TRINITY_DN1286_c0_g1_i1:260-1537(-)
MSVNNNNNNNNQKQYFSLQAEDELRIEVDKDETIVVLLKSGTAEIFGTELAKLYEYEFTYCKFAIFSWQGCEIDLFGKCRVYKANETPMIYYINAHTILEEKRSMEIVKEEPFGPRVMIVGSTDTGKSSLAKILLSYATRNSRVPIFVDLDIGQGTITIPGQIAAVTLHRPINIEEGLDSLSPLVYFYGEVDLNKNPAVYKLQLKSLAEDVFHRMKVDCEVGASGCIINTCGWVEGLGYELQLYTIDTFNVNVIFVMDNERLYNDLSNVYKDKDIEVVKLQKSGGVVTRSSPFRKNTRKKRIKEYFYGPGKGDLCPHQIILNFSNITIFKLGTIPNAPSSALPIGMESLYDPTQLEEVNPTNELLHSILAVTHAESSDNIICSNIAGYLYITNIDLDRKKISVLAPCPGPLPSRYLLLTSLKWVE